MIQIQCPNCREAFLVPEQSADSTVACGKCRQPVFVPPLAIPVMDEPQGSASAVRTPVPGRPLQAPKTHIAAEPVPPAPFRENPYQNDIPARASEFGERDAKVAPIVDGQPLSR